MLDYKYCFQIDKNCHAASLLKSCPMNFLITTSLKLSLCRLSAGAGGTLGLNPNNNYR